MLTDYTGLVLRIAVILVLAFVVRWLLHRTISRIVRRAVATPTVPEALRGRFIDTTPAIAAERRRQRAETVGSVLRSFASIVVFGIAFAMVLSEFEIDLGPAIAGAGIVGVALGFGAQNLVKDFLNGIFMILEDQYGVGDAVDVGEASGIVESVGLRTTRLRSVDGTVWHVRNGEVLRVGNMSQGWSRALLDVSVAYGTDVDHASDVIKRVADEVWRGDRVGEFVLDEPEVWGVEQLGADGIAIRLVVKTAPLEQWKVARELRRALKEAFDDEGIEIPFPQRALWIRSDPEHPPQPVTDPTPAMPAPSPQPSAAADSALERRAMKRPPLPVPGGEADAMRSDTSALRRPDPPETVDPDREH
ncbi:MAG TPA: mechanosensitive ion channel domain-containing protein [Mycobacteriales bacterium]|nr:mechanosensitive ion channel domain-containing protein [Mycobacteriales bacterium]